jgi:hypothetical protein
MLYPQTPMQGMRIGENYSYDMIWQSRRQKEKPCRGERGFLEKTAEGQGDWRDGRLLASSICGHCGWISQRYGASA